QVGGHLVREHLDEPEPEEMRRVAAVGKRADVAAVAGRAARPAVAGGAAVGEAGAERALRRDVAARGRVHARAEPLARAELALEDLPAAANRAGRIALDEVDGRPRRRRVALAAADLACERLADTTARRHELERRVDQLAIG